MGAGLPMWGELLTKLATVCSYAFGTTHHLLGVQQQNPFCVSLMRKSLPPLPVLTGVLFWLAQTKHIALDSHARAHLPLAFHNQDKPNHHLQINA